jgi:hypothetical protein
MRRRTEMTVVLALVCAGCGLVDSLTEPSSLTIESFTAAPEQVAAGSQTLISWSVAGADLVEIDHGVGPVRADGSFLISPPVTTTYTLIAIAGASQATASVRVTVEGTSPTPTPEPTATPEPTPTPTPTPTPEPLSCGSATQVPNSCALGVTRYVTLPAGQCLELNEVAVDSACPVADGSKRVLSFTVTARTGHSFLRWRQAAGSADGLLPSEGFVAGDDVTTVLLNDSVRGPSVSIDLFDPDDRRLLSFTLHHR